MINAKSELRYLKHAVELILAVAAFAGILYGAGRFIDSRVETTIQNESFVNNIAKKLRPSLIFDGNGSIIADMGACGLIESITVTNDPALNTQLSSISFFNGRGEQAHLSMENKSTEHPNRIIVTPKRHLSFPPLLEPLSPALVHCNSRRGTGHQWIYEVNEGIVTFETKHPSPIQFRLEVIQQ